MPSSQTHSSRPVIWQLSAVATAALLTTACGGSAEDSKAEANSQGPTAQAAAVTWTNAANEWASFTLTATETVRYGANSTWINKTLKPGTHQCTNAYFGYDPAPTINKKCQRPSGQPDAPAGATWERNALAGKSFTVLSDQTVRFGAGTTWILKTVTAGTYACDTTTFNADPAPGVSKLCEQAAAPVTANPWSALAGQWTNFTLSRTQLVRYGKNTTWVYRTLPAGTYRCDDAMVGFDPLPNVVKQCDQATADNPRIRPLSPSSPWNQAIPLNATYAAATDARVQSFRNFSDKLRVNTASWTQRFYQASTTDPNVTFKVDIRSLDSQINVADPRANTVTLKMPVGAYPDIARLNGPNATPATAWNDDPDGKDAAITIIDPDGMYAHEFWHAEIDASTGEYNAAAYTRVPLASLGVYLTGNEVATRLNEYYNTAFLNHGWGATRAYGGSSSPGTIRAGEALYGPINHALGIAINPELLQKTSTADPATYPAAKDDDNPNYSGSIRMGTRLAIPRSVNLQSLGLSPVALRLATALQTYGAFVVDQSGGPRLYSDAVAAQADGDALNAVGADLDKIHNALTIVNP